MEKISALLEERPVDVDFSLFERTAETEFIKEYYDRYGELPAKSVFESEMQIDLPKAEAPWSFYEKKLKEEKFIREALPALERYNRDYANDPKDALLHLRERLLLQTPCCIFQDAFCGSCF